MSNSHLKNITVERVHDTKTMKEWYGLFIPCFPDPDDRLSYKQLLGYLKNDPDTLFFLARDNNGKPLGIEMAHLTATGAAYIPYSATRDGDRNKGVNPAAAQEMDKIYKAAGATHCLIDVEDKRAIPAGVYDEYMSKLKEQGFAHGAAVKAVERLLEGRQNYWRRQGYVMVIDPQLPYSRPASSDESQIQAYDTLIFRQLDPKDPKWNGLFNADKTAISMSAYRDFYLEITRAQYGNFPESELKAQFPAVKGFLDSWQTLVDGGKQWAMVRTDAIRPSAHPKVEIHVTGIQPNRVAANDSRPGLRRDDRSERLQKA